MQQETYKIIDPPPEPRSPVVQMINITKRFPGVVANDRVCLNVNPGEVLGLVGENGAGKTTLMNILYGLYQPDKGTILIDGKKAQIRSPHDAIALGVGMVHQHFMLVRTFSVTENLVLGLAESGSPFLDLPGVEAKIRGLSESYCIPVDPRVKIWQLSVGEQQRVEILDALLREARVLILDEPTSVLTPQEAEALFNTFRLLTQQGKSVIFITHKLDETITATDRVTVLRRGRVVGTTRTSETTERDLATMMVGREVLFSLERKPLRSGSELLSVEGLWVRGDKGLPAVKGVSFFVREGEILGIAGVDGNGQRELCEALVGLRPIESGQVTIKGVTFSQLTSREAIGQGVGYIPEDRQRTGLVLDFPLWRNAVLKRYAENQFCGRLLLRFQAIITFARKLIQGYDIRVPSEWVVARAMSGGNQQRLVLARELSSEPDILIANQPTRGLDIGATEYVRSKLLEQRDAGRAILLLSRELNEVLSLSDRVAVIYEGQIVDTMSAAEADVERVGPLMAGLQQNESGDERTACQG